MSDKRLAQGTAALILLKSLGMVLEMKGVLAKGEFAEVLEAAAGGIERSSNPDAAEAAAILRGMVD